jgi:hypothetical protein
MFPLDAAPMQDAGLRVLILANSSLIRGLLRAYLDHAGHTPLDADPDEEPERAVERLRPQVVLLDCDVPGTCEDRFVEHATALGARVLLFSPARDDYAVQALARERGLPWFGMPLSRSDFFGVLQSLDGVAPSPPSATGGGAGGAVPLTH